jgi:hypothetical protein
MKEKNHHIPTINKKNVVDQPGHINEKVYQETKIFKNDRK